MKLSVLICTIEERKARFDVLMNELERLRNNNPEIELLSECDNRQISIGAKRNILLGLAVGDYVCFVDDDDWVDSEYFIKILQAISVEPEPDCVKLIGMMNTNGYNMRRFEHSNLHEMYFERNRIYYRYPNHLNPIKRSIAIQFKFPETNHGEDTDWATQIRDSKLLQREEPTDKVLYHYRYSSRK